MWTTDSLENTLFLGKIEGKRRRGWQRMRWLDSITDFMGMNLSKLQEIGRTEEPGELQSLGVTKSQRKLSDSPTEAAFSYDLHKKAVRSVTLCHLFTQQIFLEHLWYAKHCYRCSGYIPYIKQKKKNLTFRNFLYSGRQRLPFRKCVCMHTHTKCVQVV